MTKLNQTSNSSWLFEVDKTNNWAYMNDVFSLEECKKIIEIGESKLLKKAKVSNNNVISDARNSEISWLYATDDMEWAFRRVTDVINHLNHNFFHFDLFGFVEGFQFTRYKSPSGFYGLHMDKMFDGTVRKLSLTIELSDPKSFKGGDLVLQMGKTPDVMTKQQGKLTAFPSYILHEIKPVTKGTRYSLVSWITGKPFK